MEHVFKAEIHLGKTDDGNYAAIHDSQRLKFCFLADSERSVLKKWIRRWVYMQNISFHRLAKSKQSALIPSPKFKPTVGR